MINRTLLAAQPALGTLVLALAAPAHAQATAAQADPGQTATAPAGSESDAVTAGDIVVTAQRRAESIQRVPVSLTAVTADTLRSQQINDLTQLSRVAPSLQLGTEQSFAVRGVGTLSFSGTIDSSVAVAIDDVNYSRPFLTVAKFLDVDRVEVLNGPQGLLFGKNASSGLLNIVTGRPKLDQLSIAADLEFSDRDRPGTNGSAPGVVFRETLNLPVASGLALRLSGLYAYEEPPQTYVGKLLPNRRNDLDRKTYQLKGKLLFEPGNGLSVYVIGDYNKLTGAGGILTTTYRQTAPNSVNLPALAGDGITASPDNFLLGGDGGYYRTIDTGGAQASIGYTFGSGIAISNLAAWRYYGQDQQLDSDYVSVNSADTNRNFAHYNQYSDELRLTLPADNRLTGQLGFYAFKSQLNVDSLIGGNNYFSDAAARNYPFCVGAMAVPGAAPPTCSVSNLFFLGSDRVYKLDTRSLAGFGQLTYSVAGGLKLIAGGRVTNDKVNLDLNQIRNRYFVSIGGPTTHPVQEFSNTNFSWKLGAQYQFTPVIMVYGFYGRGYKGPGFNDTATALGQSLAIRPETSDAAEIGIKSSFLDRRLTINVSAFTTKFNDFQVQAFDPSTRTFFVQNAAAVRSKGIELTLGVLPFRGFSINGGASFLSSKFISFPGAQCYGTQTTGGCSTTVKLFDAAGLTLPVAPSLASNVLANYDLPVAGRFVPFVQMNWYHRSSVWYTNNHTPGTQFGVADVLTFTGGARIGDNARVAVFCRNCTNVHIPTSIAADPGDNGATPSRITNTQSFNLESVRAIGATLGFKF